MSAHPNFQPVRPGPFAISLLMVAISLQDLAILPGHHFPPGSQFLDHLGRLFLFENGATVDAVSLTNLSGTVSTVVLHLTIEKKPS